MTRLRAFPFSAAAALLALGLAACSTQYAEAPSNRSPADQNPGETTRRGDPIAQPPANQPWWRRY